MNTQEINGFKIDKFNQYDLPVGKNMSTCPKCSASRKPANQKKKVLLVDWERGLATCQHCGDKLQLHTYLKRNSDKEYIRPEWKNQTELSDKAVQWFAARGISQNTLKDFKISEGSEYMPQVSGNVNTIQFNYFEDGELINIKYRDGKKNFKLVKDAERIFYNIDSTVGSDYIVIVEGELDALACHEAGVTSVVSVPNGATTNSNNLDYLDNCIDYFADKQKVILAVDNDEAGQALQQEFIRRLGAEICHLADFGEHKDANDYLIANGSDRLNRAILNAPACPLDHILTFNDINDDFEDFVENGFKPGFTVGLDSFDDIFSTYTSQFITVTGIPSSGKSDFVDQMAVGYNFKYDWKVAFASPENKPTFLHAHKLFRKMYGDMPRHEDLQSSKALKVKERLNDYFFFMDFEDGYDLDSVLKKGAELVKRKGIKLLVIDPYNKVKLRTKRELSIVDYTMEYLNKIDTFCKKYDVLVALVAHPRKMNRDANGQLEMPNMYDIKGGGEFYDASYHGLVVHRNYEKKTTTVKVLKVKFQNLGENGAESEFTWDPKSGRFNPHKDVVDKNEMPW